MAVSSLKTMQDYTFVSKYARYNKEKKRRETWNEAVDRVMNMHLEKYKDFPDVTEDIKWAFEQVRQKRVLGSQRALQFGGPPILKLHSRLYNCISSYCDRPRFFQECFQLLLCGSGTGLSVQKHHIEKLPEFCERKNEKKTFVVSDSIEGWADALGVLVSSYLKEGEFSEFKGYQVKFDYSKIRPEGAPLSSSSGKAPGPEPLKKAIERIRNVFENRINGMRTLDKDGCWINKIDGEFANKLRPIDAYDIVMHASDAVLSGGVRRSSTLVMFSPDDEEMLNAKIGNWFEENPQRGRSNNSVLLLRDKTSFSDFEKIIQSTRQFGEPGFIFSDNSESLFNPCFHKNSRILTDKGLIKIEDLYLQNINFMVGTDSRILSRNEIDLKNKGFYLCESTKVKLTQKNADIYTVRTDHGHSIDVTLNHEFPTLNGRKQLKDIIVGDNLLLQSEEGTWGTIGDFNDGLIIGIIAGDGTFGNKDARINIWESDFYCLEDLLKIIQEKHDEKVANWNNANVGFSKVSKKTIARASIYKNIESLLGCNPREIKNRVPENIWKGSRDFVRGYLQGFFFADGSVQFKERGNLKSTLSLRLTQSNFDLLRDIQVLLQNFGVSSKIYPRYKEGYRDLPDGKGGKKPYFCKEVYELIINRPNCIKFMEKVGIYGRKKDLIEKYIEIRGTSCRKEERHICTVTSIDYKCNDDVYCFNQPTNNTVIANGIVTGQCVEANFYSYDEETGKSGWQACNLCEINGKKIKTIEDFEIAAKAGAIIGTIQAGYTDFPYLGEISEKIIKREALLGVSITGIMDNPDILLNPEIQRKMAKLVVKTNEEIAKKININPTARATNTKPAGTSSLMLGTSSGIHPHHATRYFRRMQGNRNEAPLQYFKLHNPLAVEKSVWSANDTDEIITFCVEVPDGLKTKNQMSALDLLENVKLTQQNWVGSGTVKERCTKPWLHHNVSNTIHVRSEKEWAEVTKYIYENRKYFAGVSLIPISGDLDYPQAPMCAVHTPKEIVQEYGDGALMASGLIVDCQRIFDDLWDACTYLNIEEKELDKPNKKEKKKYPTEYEFNAAMNIYNERIDWFRRVRQFADRYIDGDVRKTTYLLKEVHNWKLWCDLKRSYVEPDYSHLIEEEDNTKLLEEVACAGGKCELA